MPCPTSRRLRICVAGVRGIAGPTDVTLTPDQSFVLVTGAPSDAVAVFQRDANTEKLVFVQVLRNNIGGVGGLEIPRAIVTTPAGETPGQTFVGSGGNSSSLGGLALFDINTSHPEPIQLLTSFANIEMLGVMQPCRQRHPVTRQAAHNGGRFHHDQDRRQQRSRHAVGSESKDDSRPGGGRRPGAGPCDTSGVELLIYGDGEDESLMHCHDTIDIEMVGPHSATEVFGGPGRDWCGSPDELTTSPARDAFSSRTSTDARESWGPRRASRRSATSPGTTRSRPGRPDRRRHDASVRRDGRGRRRLLRGLSARDRRVSRGASRGWTRPGVVARPEVGARHAADHAGAARPLAHRAGRFALHPHGPLRRDPSRGLASGGPPPSPRSQRAWPRAASLRPAGGRRIAPSDHPGRGRHRLGGRAGWRARSGGRRARGPQVVPRRRLRRGRLHRRRACAATRRFGFLPMDGRSTSWRAARIPRVRSTAWISPQAAASRGRRSRLPTPWAFTEYRECCSPPTAARTSTRTCGSDELVSGGWVALIRTIPVSGCRMAAAANDNRRRLPPRPLRDPVAPRCGRDGRSLPGAGLRGSGREVAIKVLPAALRAIPSGSSASSGRRARRRR